MIRFAKLSAGLALALTAAITPPAFADEVRLDFTVAADVGASAIFSGSTTPSGRPLFVDVLDIPAPLADLMAENLTFSGFIEFDPDTPLLASDPVAVEYGGTVGLNMTRAGQAIEIRDASASLIIRQQFFDGVEWLVAVGGDNSGALDFVLPAPVTHEIEFSGELLAQYGAPETVPTVRIRASYDTVTFSSVAFALQDGIDPILNDHQLPPLADLQASPLQPFLTSLEWTAAMKFELVDTGYANAEAFAAMQAWLAENFPRPRLISSHNFLLNGLRVSAVPEPASALMWLSGIALLCGVRRRLTRCQIEDPARRRNAPAPARLI